MSKETDELREKLKPEVIYVIIVNDCEEDRAPCAEVCINSSYEVSQYPSYEELFTALENDPILLKRTHVIVADNQIDGGMLGIDAVKMLRNNDYKGIIIAYSGRRDYRTINKFRENGVDAFVPLHEGPDILLQGIKKLLSQVMVK